MAKSTVKKIPAKKSTTLKTVFATAPRVALAGSTRSALPGSTPEAGPKLRGNLTVSVIVKRKAALSQESIGGAYLTRAQYRATHGADPEAIKAVKAFAAEFGLSAEADAARRTILVSGSLAALQTAFSVKLYQHVVGDQTYRVRQGDICLPEQLIPYVEAVLGLDNRPQAQPHFRVTPRATGTSFTPVQVAKLYNFPTVSAKGQTIALIELGGGFRPADITAYFKTLGITAPKVTAVLVDKAKNAPTTPDGADGEVMLDIDVAGGAAPGANIAVYFAPNTDQGFVDAITTAIHDTTNKPTVISISWGSAEPNWTAQARAAMDSAFQSAAALGITVTVAAGDNGSSDGETDGKNHVDYPASSPYVLGCGGTRLTASGSDIATEVVWNETASNEGATGGGISADYPQPTWQASIAATKTGRGVPDVGGNADPTTGYQVRVDGQTIVVGGTSAVAPLWAALVALINAQNKSSVGLLQPRLYAAAAVSGFHDITQGNNGSFKAAKGWDACTGLGSPNGMALAA
ncbi:MAG: S53 family peptidase, partial [Janthinobacterium lividum]